MAQDLNHLDNENPIWRSMQADLAAQAESEQSHLPVELHPVIVNLAKKWGVGATWPPVGPLAVPGAAPFWVERWNVVLAKITEAKMDLRSQAKRLRRAAEIMQDRKDASKPDYRAAIELQGLESSSRLPVRTGVAELPLWGCTCECGLLLVHGNSDQIRKGIQTRDMVTLREHPNGGAAMLRIDCAFEIPWPQAAYWSWAAQECHILFTLAEGAVVDATLVGSPEPGNSQ